MESGHLAAPPMYQVTEPGDKAGHSCNVPLCILLNLKGKTIFYPSAQEPDEIQGGSNMKIQRFILLATVSVLMGTAASPSMAGKPDGKGGGGKDKDSSPGQSGFNTPNPISLTIIFRDGVTDGIQSDGGPYHDESPELSYPLDAHIDGDTGGSYGNLFLRTAGTDPGDPRTLFLDIASGCVTGCKEGEQPFQAREFHVLGLNVAATESIAGGLCGMANGQIITAPMRITYADSTTYGMDNPGFIDFFPVSKGKSPCRNSQASDVTVQRHGDSEWTVSGGAACVTWPGGRQFGGVVVMPFELTANINGDALQACN
jgi:hypothetical protein